MPHVTFASIAVRKDGATIANADRLAALLKVELGVPVSRAAAIDKAVNEALAARNVAPLPATGPGPAKRGRKPNPKTKPRR